MRKLLLILTLLLVVVPSTVIATPVKTLTTLAQYYPQDTPFFIALRTDDAYIQTLDAVLQRASAAVPGAIPPVRLPFLLNVATFQAIGQSFDEDIRPWLGDSAAIGLLYAEDMINPVGSPEFLLAVEIADREAALEFWQGVFGESTNIEQSSRRGYDLFLGENGDFAMAIGDDVLFVSLSEEGLPLNNDFLNLAENEGFNASMSALPEPSYNIFIYLDNAALQAENLRLLQSAGLESPLFEFSANAVRAQSIAFTILNNEALTIDTVAVLNDTQVFGMSTYNLPPVEPQFANRVPADAPLVILGTDLGPALLVGFNNLRQLDRLVEEIGGWGSLFRDLGLRPQDVAALNSFSFGGILGALNFSFAGLTGLSLEREVLPLLVGDHAIFLRAVDDAETELFPDIALFSETNDAEAVDALVEQIADALDAYITDYDRETVGDADVLAIHWLQSLVDVESENADILVGSDDTLFVFGTRGAVKSVLTSGGGLGDEPDYIAASDYFLPNTIQVWYLGMDPIIDIIDTLLGAGILSPSAQTDLEGIRPVLALIESASVTTMVPDDNTTVARFVLTVGDEPLPAGSAGAPPMGEAITRPAPTGTAIPPTAVIMTPTATPRS